MYFNLESLCNNVFIRTSSINIFSDDDLHKIMDINKVFPKPREVEEELKKKKDEDEKRAEAEEMARMKSLAPPTVAPKMSQLIEEPFNCLEN